MGMCYDGFIEFMLNDLSLEYKARDRYYITQNPFMNDSKPSFVIYRDGWCKSYNGDIDGKNVLFIKQVAKKLGYMSKLIEFILSYNNIPVFKYNQFKSSVINNESSNHYFTMKKVGITKKDVLSTETIGFVDRKKFSNIKKKTTSNINEVEINKSEVLKCKKYIEERKLDLCSVLEPVKLNFDGVYDKLAIAIRYQDKFTKYRFLTGKFRYLCKGTYGELLEVRNESSELAIVAEGELEAMCIKNVNCDVYAMHNCNTITDAGLNQLTKYKKIIFFVDYDKFKEVKKSLESKVKNSKVYAKFYSDDKSLDFNSYIVKNSKEELEDKINKFIKGVM